MAKNTLKEQAYAIIKENIINCVYAPSSFLVESELMQQVGASRTPIREALNKLEQENLVRILPKRGVLVSDITMGTLNEVYEVRRLVEPYIVREYGCRLDGEALRREYEQVKQSARLPTGMQLHRVDNDLHQMLLNVSGNSYLCAMMDNIYGHNNRIRVFSGMKVAERRSDTCKEHLEILRFLLEQDYERAAQAMLTHLENSKQTAVRALLAAGTPNHG